MRATDREHIKAKGNRSAPGYAIEWKVHSLMDSRGTGNDLRRARATPLYLAGVQSQGLEGPSIVHTEESHCRGQSDDRRDCSAGPIGACLGPLQERSLLSSKEQCEVLLYHLSCGCEWAYTGRHRDTT